MQSHLKSERTRPIVLVLPGLASFLGCACSVIFFFLTFCVGAAAATEGKVETIAGGRLSASGPDAGFVDGNALQMSQFNTPFDCALDGKGNLLIADRGNNAVRKLDLGANRSSTVATGLSQPVAVVVDSKQNIFVLSRGDGVVRQVNSFGTVSSVATGFFGPTAMAADGQGLLYITEENGGVTQLNPATGIKQTIATVAGEPGGVAVLPNGILVVSVRSRNQVRFIDPQSEAVLLQVGTGEAGFRDGPAGAAQFNQPHKVATAPDGSVVVADRANHRVRRISSDGVVTTLYGVDPSTWEGPACVTCNPEILPGWLDGPVQFAEVREPVGVTVDKDGTLFDTEVFYHIIRKVTGLALTPTGGGPTGTNTAVLPPRITPNSGYFPMGIDILVEDPNTSPVLKSLIFFTTDGSEPTTNSLMVAMNGRTGTIHWRESLRDLTSLHVKTFIAAASSPTVSGVPSPRNEIGMPRDVTGGIGSTLVLPIVVNLKEGVVLRSLAFVAQVSPASPDVPPVSAQFRPLRIDAERDFIPVAGASEAGKTSVFTVVQSSLGSTQRLGIAYVSTNSHFLAKSFAAVVELVVPIPPAAAEGMHYTLQVLNASGSTDIQEGITLDLMPARDIAVRNLSYLVGDTAPAAWYNAGDFGDNDLQISDADRAFNASLGFQVPFPFSDVFDAMDAYPEDSSGLAGGDGQIRFLDWQVILRRALRFDTKNWQRHRTAGGTRTAVSATLPSATPAGAAADSPASTVTGTNNIAWYRQAALGAGTQGNVAAGNFVSVPIYARLAPGCSLSGSQFRVRVEGTPAIAGPVKFTPATGLPDLIQPPSPFPANEAGGAWNLGTFNPPLRGSNFLGALTFQIPFGALIGQTYAVRFVAADGSPDPPALYQFETVTGRIWVGTEVPAAELPAIISDDWKTFFFGNPSSPSAVPTADPDGDGIPNWKEFLAGTDPTRGPSEVSLFSPELRRTNGAAVLVLRWASTNGRIYRIESANSLVNPVWTAVTTVTGTGQVQEYVETSVSGPARYYRIRLP